MKKIIAIICATIMSIGAANAQVEKSDFAIGANLLYGSGIKSMGFGGRIQYTPVNHVRAEMSLNYFFQKDYVSMWDINLNAEYLVNLYQHKFYIYPIVGLSFAKTSFDAKKFYNDHGLETDPTKFDDKAFGLNLGAGLEYRLTDHVGLSLEYRHSLMKHIDQGVLGIGANYKF